LINVNELIKFPAATIVFSALRGRIYLPQDELRKSGLKDEDIFSRKATDKWREFMKKQIMQAEQGVSQLDQASRWPECTYHIVLLDFAVLMSRHFSETID